MPGDDASIDPELLAAVRRVQLDRPGLGLKKLVQQLATESPPLNDVTAKAVRLALTRLEAEVEVEATQAAGGPSTRPIEIIQHVTDGFNLHATRTIEAGEVIIDEEPLIKTAPGPTGSVRTEQCLKAFCAASGDLQTSVLGMFSPLAEANLSEPIAIRLSPVETYARKAWARGQPLQTLRKAQLAFELNAHAIGKSSEALFELSAKINHSCDPNANFCVHEGRLRHVAICRIERGEPITSNYIGDHAIMHHAMRQERLYAEKLFRCACPRCSSDDWARTVPCPGCHPRDWSGRLPESSPAACEQIPQGTASCCPASPASPASTGEEVSKLSEAAHVAYATPIVAPNPTWRCATCQQSWGTHDVSPAINTQALRHMPPEAHIAAASLDARLLDEPLLCDAVHNYTDQVLRGSRPLGYAEVASLVHATSRLLGARHWATAQSYSMVRRAGSEPASLSPT